MADFTIFEQPGRKSDGTSYVHYGFILGKGKPYWRRYWTRAEAEQAARRELEKRATRVAVQRALRAAGAPPVQVGSRVTRIAEPGVPGTITGIYGRKARVCWDRTLRGGSRVGGGTSFHSVVLLSSLRRAAEEVR